MSNTYKVNKTVCIGSNFVEHKFEGKNENIFGRWIKAGQEVQLNVSNFTLICDYCLNDSIMRSQNKIRHPETNEVMDRSYQVEGKTKTFQKVDQILLRNIR